MANPKNRYMMRGIIASVLTVLSLVCLFWPSMINLSASARENYFGPALDDIETRFGSMDEYFDEFEEKAVDELKEAGYGTAKAKSLTSAMVEMEKVALTGKYSFFGVKTVIGFFDRFADELNRNSPLREMASKSSGFESLMEMSDEGATALKIVSIVLNILLYGMLALGALAILMYLLGKNRVFGVLHTILAFLVALAFIGIVILANIGAARDSRIEGDILAVGIGSVLMPLFALAACIVYKRDKKGAAPVEAPVQTFAPTTAPQQPVNPWASAPQQPSNPQWGAQQPSNPQWGAQQPRQGAWSDVSGWGEQPQSAPQQPQAEVPTWTCPVCGTKNPTTTAFCPNCGTNQES